MVGYSVGVDLFYCPVFDVPSASQPHGFVHAPVVGDKQDGPVECLKSFFKLFDGGQVQVVGGFVEDEQVHAPGLEKS